MKTISVDSLRVASPCPTNWESMKGDDRVRFCDLCNLNVYNFAELTRKELDALVANTEGRLCGRLYRRSDGTVITKDCPVGLRALRRRVATVAGAVFATVMSLCSTIAGQQQSSQDKSGCKKQISITRQTSDTSDDAGMIAGKILDPVGAVVPGARVTITDRRTKRVIRTESNNEGEFRVTGLDRNLYEIVVEVTGFKKLTVTDVTVNSKQRVNMQIILEPRGEVSVTVGLIAEEPLIEPGKLIINQNMVHRIPR